MALSTPVLVSEPAFTPFQLVAIGASAGGLAPLADLLQRLPKTFTVPIVVVQHLGAHLPSLLPQVLNFRSALPCRWACDGDTPQPGHVLCAPAGANLVLTPEGRLARIATDKPRMGWPSVDVFFGSMAARLGRECIGVILSGMMHDGADGIAAVRRAGGATMAQHPGTAEFPDMPEAAVDLGRADLTMPASKIAEALMILAEEGVR